MTARDPNFDAYVLKIHGVLDRLDYYRLLGVESSSGVSDIRRAFYAIAAKFHPDRNRDAAEKVRRALYDIFKRLNEAYRVLCDAEKRRAYDDGLTQGKVRLEQESRRGSGPKNPEDTIKSREARQFYRKAKEELQKNNLMHAELHIKVAASREPGSKVIKELAAEILSQKKQKK